MTSSLVFVYGTLKRAQPNHGLLTDTKNGTATYLGTGKLKNAYPLVIASSYNIPFLLAEKGKGESVEGEVYDVDQNMVLKLDDLEGHPQFYERFLTSVYLDQDAEGVSLQSPTLMECWCYFMTNFKPKFLELPFLRSYDSNGPHGLYFKPSYTRRAEDNYDLLADIKLK